MSPEDRQLLRSAIIQARAVLCTAAGDTAADLEKPVRSRVLSRRVDQLNAALDVLNRNEPEARAAPLIAQGERFTCTRGHYIGTASRDLFKGDIFVADMIEDLQGPPLAPHAKCGICTCGARWATRGWLHTESGWSAPERVPAVHEVNAIVPEGYRPDVLRHGPQ